MRRLLTVSVRGLVLALAFCMLGGAAGCGKETFDLLAMAGAGGSFSGASGAGSSGAGAGAGGSLGGALQGGSAGQASAGAAGRRNFPEGGTGGNAPCLNGAMCAGTGGGTCNASTPFCTPCQSDKDCPSEAPNCDSKIGRCYQCRHDNECPTAQRCNTLGLICATPCKEDKDCSSDDDHRVCNTDFDVCVSCMSSFQCSLYNPGASDRCYFSSCVQCAEDRDCGSNQYCLAGRCQKPH